MEAPPRLREVNRTHELIHPDAAETFLDVATSKNTEDKNGNLPHRSTKSKSGRYPTRGPSDLLSGRRPFAVADLVSGDSTSALWVAGFGVAMGASSWWGFMRAGKGEIALNSDGIIEKSKFQTMLIPWAHMKAARIRSTTEEKRDYQILTRLFSKRKEHRYVEIQLDRWIYSRMWRARLGTAESGFPTFQSKHKFFTLEPDAPLAEIQQHVPVAGPESPLDVDPVT